MARFTHNSSQAPRRNKSRSLQAWGIPVIYIPKRTTDIATRIYSVELEL